MEYVVKLPNNQLTFDWLEGNIDDWWIDDEDMEFVCVCFLSTLEAEYAKQSLT